MSHRHTKKVVTISASRLVQILGAFFILITVAGYLVLHSYESQADELATAQAELNAAQGKIAVNTRQIQETNYERCLDGVKILIKFNGQQEDLKEIVAARTDLPEETKQAYINAYNRAIVDPIPSCAALKPPVEDGK